MMVNKAERIRLFVAWHSVLALTLCSANVREKCLKSLFQPHTKHRNSTIKDKSVSSVWQSSYLDLKRNPLWSAAVR